MSADGSSNCSGVGVAGTRGEGPGQTGGKLAGMGPRVGSSAVVTEELDAARCLVFDFKGGGAESASRR